MICSASIRILIGPRKLSIEKSIMRPRSCISDIIQAMPQSWDLGSLEAFELAYNPIADLMPTFTANCEIAVPIEGRSTS
jgi:hypothetical protein